MALIDQTKKAWLDRYYPKDPTSKICEFCGKPLTKNHFIDFLQNSFCNKACFNLTKHFRDPQVFKIQKLQERYNKNQLITKNQKGR